MDDTISRQAAVEALDKFNVFGYVEEPWEKLRDALQALPAAEPEIIRCRECKHSEQWYRKCRCFLWSETGIGVFEDGFCNYAERRTND